MESFRFFKGLWVILKEVPFDLEVITSTVLLYDYNGNKVLLFICDKNLKNFSWGEMRT